MIKIKKFRNKEKNKHVKCRSSSYASAASARAARQPPARIGRRWRRRQRQLRGGVDGAAAGGNSVAVDISLTDKGDQVAIASQQGGDIGSDKGALDGLVEGALDGLVEVALTDSDATLDKGLLDFCNFVVDIVLAKGIECGHLGQCGVKVITGYGNGEDGAPAGGNGARQPRASQQGGDIGVDKDALDGLEEVVLLDEGDLLVEESVKVVEDGLSCGEEGV